MKNKLIILSILFISYSLIFFFLYYSSFDILGEKGVFFGLIVSPLTVAFVVKELLKKKR